MKTNNLYEKTHRLINDNENRFKQRYKKVVINEFIKIESIIHINTRWNGKLTNKFTIN